MIENYKKKTKRKNHEISTNPETSNTDLQNVLNRNNNQKINKQKLHHPKLHIVNLNPLYFKIIKNQRVTNKKH